MMCRATCCRIKSGPSRRGRRGAKREELISSCRRPGLSSPAISPVAQAAWIYDIFNAGTGNTGDPEAVLSRDAMLDEITLYWLTNSAASSARFYLEQAALLNKRNNPGRIDLPLGVNVYPHDLPAARSWAPMVYPRLFYWNELIGAAIFIARGSCALHGGVAPLFRAMRSA